MKTAARRAQLKAICSALITVSSVLIAFCGYFLVVVRPFEWQYLAGLVLGVALYALAESLIPLYAKPD